MDTNRLIIGDVGGNDLVTAREEITVYHLDDGVVNGGWPNCQGFDCPAGQPADVRGAVGAVTV